MDKEKRKKTDGVYENFTIMGPIIITGPVIEKTVLRHWTLSVFFPLLPSIIKSVKFLDEFFSVVLISAVLHRTTDAPKDSPEGR